jgi:hypothetical protein
MRPDLRCRAFQKALDASMLSLLRTDPFRPEKFPLRIDHVLTPTLAVFGGGQRSDRHGVVERYPPLVFSRPALDP